MKRKRFLLTMTLFVVGALFGGNALLAQTPAEVLAGLTGDYYNKEDISSVITNPGAEDNMNGWTMSSDDAFKTQQNDIFDKKVGNYYFEQWQGSGGLSDRSMYQTLAYAKEGYYTIEVVTNVDRTGAYLYANDVKVDLTEKNADGLVSLTVFVDENGTLEYGVKLENCQDNWVAFDNFKMYYSKLQVFDGIYYLYNDNANDLNRFLARGNDFGTRAVVDPYGIPVRITNIGDNVVTMQFVDTNGYMFTDNNNNIYTDGDAYGSGDRQATSFEVSKTTVDGVDSYQFARNSNNQYLNVDNTNIVYNGQGTVWKLLSPAERNEIVNSYPGKNAEAMATAAGSMYKKPQDLPNNQMTYWLEAMCTPIDKTPESSTWTFTPVRGNSTPGSGNAEGTTELYGATGTFSQTLSDLQPGVYKITLHAFERHGSVSNAKNIGSTYGNIGAAYMTANGQQVHIAAWHEAYTGEDDPNNMGQAAAKFNNGNYTNEVYTYVGDNGQLTINVTEPGYLGDYPHASWFIMKDAIKLTYFSTTPKTTAQPTGTYYLRNKKTHEYLTFDGYWGTYYSMSDVGKQLTLKTAGDGTTLMHTTYLSNTDDVTSSHDTENYFYSYPGNIEHAFSNGNSTEGGEKWVFYSDGNGGYSIMNFMTGYYLSGSQDYDSNNRGWGGLMKTTDTDADTKWELVTKEELTKALTANGATYPLDASFLIGEPDFIVGYSNVYQEFYSWKVMGNDQYKYSDWTDANIISFYSQSNGVSTGNVAYAYSLASDYPDILQTIEKVPAGLYVVECQALFRDGNEGGTGSSTTTSSRTNDSRLADGTYVNRAYLYANDNMANKPEDAREIRDRRWIYDNAQLMPVRVATAGLFPAQNGMSHQNPDLLSAFNSEDYTVKLPIYVSGTNEDGTGTLTIGVLQEIGINDNLLIFDRFRLTYYGEDFAQVKDIAKTSLQRLQGEYTSYQSNTITAPEKTKLDNAINAIESDYTTSDKVAKYNKVAQDYGETSISWYIFNVLKTDYNSGDYTTATTEARADGKYPYVDEESKENVVKYFGNSQGSNNKNVYTGTYYTTGELTFTSAKLSDLKEAITALRTYVEANAEARYIEDDEVKVGAEYDSDQRKAARDARMALVTGREDAITSDDGLRPAYDTNPLMFTNAGVEITAPDLNKVVKNARCWAPRDAYGHRFYDYTNYYGKGPHEYEIKIDGLVTGKYLVTISESHNNELHSVLFNAYVGNNQIVENKQLFREDGSVWQSYTHSWQDVSCVVEIDDDKQFQTVRLTFTGGGEGAAGNATMNICNLRIYRMEGIEMLLLDENDTQLAKHKNYTNIKTLLKREMATNQWNTLTLPVNLTKQQVMAGFGEGTILATMDGFSEDYGKPDNCIHFTTNDLKSLGDNDTAIEEGIVYLIKPTAEPAVGKGETATYKNADEGQLTYTEIPGPVYYLDYVNYSLTTKDGDTEPNISHTPPTGGDIYPAIGTQEGKLTLQMQGTYSQKVVPVNATADGGTNYIYAFQQQTDGNVYLVELDPSNSKSYEGFEGTGRLFKGYRGWAVANYKDESAGVRESYLVLLDEGDDQLTVIRGIDSEEGYSEVKIPRQGVYDLQGRSIDRKEFYSGSYPQGVYIVDGKKVVRK